jgi:PGAP1-like protein
LVSVGFQVIPLRRLAVDIHPLMERRNGSFDTRRGALDRDARPVCASIEGGAEPTLVATAWSSPEGVVTRDEVQATVRLTGRAAAGVAQHVQRIHTAVARRVFRPLAPVAAPVALAHDIVAGAAYGAVRATLMFAGTAVGATLSATRPASAPPLSANRAGGIAQAVLNGLVGADLAASADPLAIRMAVRHDGYDVALTPGGLAEAFPDATRYVVVFIHGLFEDDASWGGVFGRRLREDLGCTAVHVRYNTGRPIADNGADLDRLLHSLVDRWPVPVERLALVGHSMGGLVARSACRTGADTEARWMPLLSDVVSLASPHRGARLAGLLGAAGRGLRRLPEVAPWADLVDHSPGVRDLQRGLDVPGVPTARHHIVWSTLDGTAGVLFGDLLVHPRSARGCDHVDAVQVSGLDHFALLTHPRVYDALRAWLSCPSAAAAAR